MSNEPIDDYTYIETDAEVLEREEVADLVDKYGVGFNDYPAKGAGGQ